MATRLVELLRSMDIFAGLSDRELGRIGRLLKDYKLSENDVIFSQGEAGDALYILLQGRVRMTTRDSSSRERVMAFYGPGEFFGETALLTGVPRVATASASTNVRLLQLHKDDFDKLVATSVGVMRAMMRVILERQAAMQTRITHEAGANAGDVQGQVTAVFSPRGGSGKTMLATNLAVALAELTPDRVVIVDLALVFGHVAMLLDLAPRTALAAITPAAISSLDADNLGFYLAKHAESSVRVLAGTLRPEDRELVTGEHARAVIGVLRRHFVQIVIDAGSHLTEACLAALELADHVIVLTTAEPATLHAVIETQRVLRELLRVPSERIQFLQNHPGPYGKLSRADAAWALGSGEVIEVPFGGIDVTRASLNGSPLVMSHPGNPVSRAILGLARQLDLAGRERSALAAR